MEEKHSIEQLLQDGHLAKAQARYSDFLRRCADEINDLVLVQGRLSKLEEDESSGIRTDAFERNRIALSFQLQIDAFRKEVLGEYFDVQDKLTFFDSIANRDSVINMILDHRLMPKNYQRDQQLVEGNSSIVYQLINPIMRRHAIALVLKTPSMRQEAKEQVERLTDLRHRNVIKVIDHDLASFPFFVITEYVYGVTMPKALEISGPRPVTQAVDWIYQLTDALDYLRHKRIFHTNMRPSKIYIDDEWQVMLSPFDLGQFSSAEQTYNRYKDVCQYGSPELVACDGVGMDLRGMCLSDQYSLGLLAYKILTGKDLFAGETIYEIMDARKKFVEDAQYRADKFAELPECELLNSDADILNFNSIVQKLLSEKTEDRYPDLHKVLRALHPLTRAEEHNVSPLRESYRRCLSINKEFIKDFYEAFTTQEIKKGKATHTFAKEFDTMALKRQSSMLQMAIDLIVDIEHSENRLKDILNNERHQKYGLPDFELFTTILIKKIKENDPKWDSFL